MTYLIEQLINGICQGAIYALFAIGYTIIVGVVGLVSFTFGEVIIDVIKMITSIQKNALANESP